MVVFIQQKGGSSMNLALFLKEKFEKQKYFTCKITILHFNDFIVADFFETQNKSENKDFLKHVYIVYNIPDFIYITKKCFEQGNLLFTNMPTYIHRNVYDYERQNKVRITRFLNGKKYGKN